jgi:hypothetical protein
MSRRKKRERTITGIIVPEDWDKENRVIRVAVKTPFYEEYVVEHNKQSKELLFLIDHKVRVRGRIRERLDGSMLISVNTYDRMEENGDDQYASGGHVG